ncbi:GPI mannosyltransferase 4-like [Dreissena polymorpha]|uniref:Mannosyltransferase n=1 Tax=Dreissena polymorpha TaxID=45954 RepID=A0A9D4GCD4_DREPO|nr:GPI mannosyltransferase 4-like [Dreissena polymorpha]XP_052216253.1 GPI mannosyltransferase 4-like [Dreissena polymorpha]KAH3812999.1 hypothetical protein DPMN_141445 [Dreissena polymorpha]
MSWIKLAWLVFLMGRAAWTFLPQMGYIHPDEFFQTVEVVAGDALNVSVIRTWEFTGEYPLRSMILPKLLFHPVFVLFKTVIELHGSEVTGYTILLASRLVMLLLSFVIDLMFFRICLMIGLRGHTPALIYASSYVTLTFQCHSFSNSIETVLAVGQFYVIFLLIKTKYEHDKDVKENNIPASENDKLLDDRALLKSHHENAFHSPRFRGKSKLGSKKLDVVSTITSCMTEDLSETIVRENYKNVIKSYEVKSKEFYPIALLVLFGSVFAFGVFNRPTFLVFGCVPFFWWVDIYNRLPNFLLMLSTVALSGFVTSVILITCDSLYYMSVKIIDLQNFGVKELLQIFCVTPLNFVMYNTNPSNLEKHGRHLRCLHLMVNLPLLLGPLLIPIWRRAFQQISRFFFTKAWKTLLKSDSDIYVTRTEVKGSSAAIEKNIDSESESVSKLNKNISKISADDVNTLDLNDSDLDYAISTENKSSEQLNQHCHGDEKVKVKLRQTLQYSLLLYIFIPVILLSLFPHQEPRFLIPVIPGAILFASLVLREKVGTLFWTIVFCFNLLMATIFGVLHQGGIIPCLMHLQKMSTEVHNKSLQKSELTFAFSHTYMPPKHLLLDRNNFINLVDFKGMDLASVCLCLKGDFTPNDSECEGLRPSETVYLAITGTVAPQFKEFCKELVRVKKVKAFFPHVSFEDLPDFNVIDSWSMLMDLFSLHLYEIKVL